MPRLESRASPRWQPHPHRYHPLASRAPGPLGSGHNSRLALEHYALAPTLLHTEPQ